MTKAKGFKIAVPTFGTNIKQGQTQNVTIALERGAYFKEDVTLIIEGSKGITFEPASTMIKASDKPNLQLRIAAARDAALGEYRVTSKGIPETGEPTSKLFTVKVLTPQNRVRLALFASLIATGSDKDSQGGGWLHRSVAVF